MRLLTVTLLAGALVSAPALHAADTGHGQELHQKQCMSCHDDKMYTRENRKVTSMEGLSKQVQRCEISLGLKWFDEDIDDVAGYLNDRYYHF